MSVDLEGSEFRVEKTRRRATLRLSTGATVGGCFFLAGASAHSSGPQRIGDVLNEESGFFPFEIHDHAGTRTVLYNRGHVVTVTVSVDEARRDPGYEVATRRVVSVGLSTGDHLVGSVRVFRPEGRDRLSDWTRQREQFRYVEGKEVTLIINMEHVIEVHEVAES